MTKTRCCSEGRNSRFDSCTSLPPRGSRHSPLQTAPPTTPIAPRPPLRRSPTPQSAAIRRYGILLLRTTTFTFFFQSMKKSGSGGRETHFRSPFFLSTADGRPVSASVSSFFLGIPFSFSPSSCPTLFFSPAHEINKPGAAISPFLLLLPPGKIGGEEENFSPLPGKEKE